MQARVSGTIEFDARDCPPKLLERLRIDLSFPNPKCISRRRMGLYTGGVPERIECLEETGDGRIQIPRGAVGLLRDRATQVGITLSFADMRQLAPPVKLQPNITLRPYQAQAVDAMARGVQGTVVMPPGAGKSATGTAAIARIGQPTLVIVHTHDLVEQWRQSIDRFLGVEAGIVSDGQRRIEPITVATVQTLVRMSRLEIDEVSRRFGCVIVDEVHHAPNLTFRVVLSALAARHRFGLTATPEREDGLSRLLDLTLGDRLFEIGYPELVAGGFLRAPEVRSVYTSFDFDYSGPDDMHACMDALVTDEKRNNLIVDLAVREASDGRTVLLLSGRVAHCLRLAKQIRERGVEAEVLVGAVKKPLRKEILDRFRNGTLPVLVASTLADEGLDVPRVDRVILAFPSRTKGRTAQRLGRLMRPHPDKDGAVLFDIVDAAVAPLLRQFFERNRLYKHLATGVRRQETT